MFFDKKIYKIFKLKDHELFKQNILNQISVFNNRVDTSGIYAQHKTFISNTDYYFGMFVRKNWFNEFISDRDRKRYFEFILKQYKKHSEVRTSWFNQYYPYSGSDHPFHEHPNCDLTNVYYIELNDKSLTTILLNPKTKERIIPKVKEGEILVFDAKILHSSPRNFSSTRKTVIAFNTHFLE